MSIFPPGSLGWNGQGRFDGASNVAGGLHGQMPMPHVTFGHQAHQGASHYAQPGAVAGFRPYRGVHRRRHEPSEHGHSGLGGPGGLGAKRQGGPVEAEIVDLKIRYDPPTINCELAPVCHLRDRAGNVVVEQDLQSMKYRWMRGLRRLCSLPGCQEGATMQCITCVKLNIDSAQSLFCSQEHFTRAYQDHRHLHSQQQREAPPASSAGWSEDEAARPFALNLPSAAPRPPPSDTPSAVSCRFPPPISNEWSECSQSKKYVPTADDVGRSLKLECAPVCVAAPSDGSAGLGPPETGKWVSLVTSAVLPKVRPPPPRRIVWNKSVPPPTAGNPRPRFRILNYNVLAEIYATRAVYPYCPMRALAWSYRRENLLREIVSHNADVVCLQEVQGNHFEDFFLPRLQLNGYEGVFKHKTRDSLGDNPKAVDGCAIFYRKDRFAVREQYAIEFDDAAKHVFDEATDAHTIRRLTKGNIALVVVLEEKLASTDRRRPKRICVANTHIFWDPKYTDVKLWQTFILCRELQKMILGRDLPLLLCGDFNSEPDSAVYELLSTERLRVDHPIFDEYKSYRVFEEGKSLHHNLPLVSAYSCINEPKYTNFTGHYVGALDYVWYTRSHLQVASVLDVDDEEQLTKHQAIPSPVYSSDHIALVVEFEMLS